MRYKERQLYEKISQSKKRLLLEKLLRVYNYEKIIYYKQMVGYIDICKDRDREIKIDILNYKNSIYYMYKDK